MWKLFHENFPFNGAGGMLEIWFTTWDMKLFKEIKFQDTHLLDLLF